MRPRDHQRVDHLSQQLTTFAEHVQPLPGIDDPAARNTFIEQLLESIHRVEFVRLIQHRPIGEARTDPNSGLFDPLKAAIVQHRSRNDEEAFWLAFLFVHFGRHRQGGWRYAREIYGRLGTGERWDWANTRGNPAGFRKWLADNKDALRRPGAGFGNHRKYESLEAATSTGTGAVVESYVAWIGAAGSHEQLVQGARQVSEGNPGTAFDILFRSMRSVKRFGRTARFDYLTMLGKLGLADIEPASPYLKGSTGPLQGAKLLFASRRGTLWLDQKTTELGNQLGLGMQVMEDALCNWQKNPTRFKQFRG